MINFVPVKQYAAMPDPEHNRAYMTEKEVF